MKHEAHRMQKTKIVDNFLTKSEPECFDRLISGTGGEINIVRPSSVDMYSGILYGNDALS
jgi:hypothetical protein